MLDVNLGKLSGYRWFETSYVKWTFIINDWRKSDFLLTQSSLYHLNHVHPGWSRARMEEAMAFDILRWRHNKRYDVSNHQRLDGLLNRLFRWRSKKTSKLCVTGLCEGIVVTELNMSAAWYFLSYVLYLSFIWHNERCYWLKAGIKSLQVYTFV